MLSNNTRWKTIMGCYLFFVVFITIETVSIFVLSGCDSGQVAKNDESLLFMAKRVCIGMTYEEVLAVLGLPDREDNIYDMPEMERHLRAPNIMNS